MLAQVLLKMTAAYVTGSGPSYAQTRVSGDRWGADAPALARSLTNVPDPPLADVR
jgi:hypothetical protein